MPGLASGIARDIREGTVKKYLIQPIDMLGFLLLYADGPQAGLLRGGGGAVRAGVLTCAAAISPAGPTPATLAAFLASLVMSFLLGFFLEATMGMIGFWFLEVSSLVFVFMLLSFFFSGHMFPLDMLPGVWGTVVKRCRCNTWPIFPRPCSGQDHGAELVRGLWIEAGLGGGRSVVASAAGRSTAACARYSGYGG